MSGSRALVDFWQPLCRKLSFENRFQESGVVDGDGELFLALAGWFQTQIKVIKTCRG
jgi:hypothetical protein